MNSYSFIHLSALGCLNIFFFLYNMSEFILQKASDKFFLTA